MSCFFQSGLPKPKPIKVNGVDLKRDDIAREVQNFPAEKPIDAWMAAARALVIRELLLNEARSLALKPDPKSEDGYSETEDEALIRALLEQEIVTPEPDEDACRRYYNQNSSRFRSVTIYEAAHILISADRRNEKEFGSALTKAHSIAQELQRCPEKFDMLAALHSDCPSAEQYGNLGQLISGQTTPEFENALVTLEPGAISRPVESRYGIHIIRLERKIVGKQIPFEAVRVRIADYLYDAVRRRALAQYIALLVSRANIEGIELANAESHRVN